MSTKPDPGAVQLLRDAERIHAEYDALVADLLANGRYPTKADQQRLKELRAEARALDSVADRLISEQDALWQAIGERLGRAAVDGDSVTPKDERRAAEILEGSWPVKQVNHADALCHFRLGGIGARHGEWPQAFPASRHPQILALVQGKPSTSAPLRTPYGLPGTIPKIPF